VKLPNTDGISVQASTFVAGELGVIAKRAYRKGELLFRVEGPVQPRPTKYSFAVSLDQHIEPERDDDVSDFGHYLNHSCEPNVIVRPVEKDVDSAHIDVVARWDIRAGEELAFDYASLEYEFSISNAVCQCGHAKCRKTIHGFKDLPAPVRGRYEEEGLIPSYLLQLAAARSETNRQNFSSLSQAAAS
jgi:hypothetical protein